MSGNPIRVDADLYAAATAAARVMSRSIGQQVAHWARIGRAIEQSPEVSVERVAEVLRGRAAYDDLSVEEQALTRTLWDERIEELRSSLRLDREMAREGGSYVELDERGEVVRREAPATDLAATER